MSSEIIYLDGKYEVHASTTDGKWAVVNADSCQVYADNLTREDAIELGDDLCHEDGDEEE